MKVLLLVSLATSGMAATSATWQATCVEHSRADSGGYWQGPERSSYDDAEKDCAVHKKSYPRHSCSVAQTTA